MKRKDYFFYKPPGKIEEVLNANPNTNFCIIDEIQKAPELLDDVQDLIENKGIVFGLCGSSARKLKRSHANLLGGRAIRYELYGLSAY